MGLSKCNYIFSALGHGGSLPATRINTIFRDFWVIEGFPNMRELLAKALKIIIFCMFSGF